MNTNQFAVSQGDLIDFAESHVNLRQPEVDRKRAEVKGLRERLETRLRDDPNFALIKMLHAGSVAKGTALATVNDMDVAVYVRAAEAPLDDKRLVGWLVDKLRDAYGDLANKISSDTHCAVVEMRSGLKVDMVPVLYEGEPNDVGYLVSKHSGRRIRTSIPRHLEFIRARKERSPAHYAQVVRFLKWWVRQQKEQDEQFRCKSFLIELIVAHLADGGLNLRSYPDALETVFAYMCRSGLTERIVFTDYYGASSAGRRSDRPIEVVDPVAPANNVTVRYEEADRARLVNAADIAVSALAEARYATSRDRAVRCWQRVLGPSFRGAS